MGNSLYSKELYVRLAAKMSPYFVGPMPIGNFLSDFLPPLSEAVPSFTKDMFPSLVSSKGDEVKFYNPFVCL